MVTAAAELSSLHKQLKAGQRAVDEAKAALEDMVYDENAVGAAEEAVAELEAELRPLRELPARSSPGARLALPAGQACEMS